MKVIEKVSDCKPVPEKLCDEKHAFMERIINHRFEAMDQALIMRQKELERRLDGLNHSFTQRETDRDLFVKKETYDLRVGYYDSYIEATRMAHQQLVNRVTIIETRSIVWTSVIGVAFTILQVLLHFFPKG